MTKFRVDITMRGGSYQSVPFPTFSAASDFFELHKNDRTDLVQLRQWMPEYKEAGWKVAGAWVIVDQWVHSHLV